MVRIDGESRGIATEEAFGPLSVLLVGFLPEDVAAFHCLMEEMEAQMIKVTAWFEFEFEYGPSSVLLVGFLPEDGEAFHRLMEEMEAQRIKVIPCNQALLKGTLHAAFEIDPVPEHVWIRGMFGSEVIDIVTSFREFGLPPSVFAVAVPNNWSRVVEGLIKEVCADDAAMKQQAAEEE
eukprot:gene10885-17006_t